MKPILALIAVLALVATSFGAPDRKSLGPPPASPAWEYPDLTGYTDAGTLTQCGRYFLIVEESQCGYGIIRDDGMLFVCWSSDAADAASIGVYRIQPNGCIWGYDGSVYECRIDEHGEIVGPCWYTVIRSEEEIPQ